MEILKTCGRGRESFTEIYLENCLKFSQNIWTFCRVAKVCFSSTFRIPHILYTYLYTITWKKTILFLYFVFFISILHLLLFLPIFHWYWYLYWFCIIFSFGWHFLPCIAPCCHVLWVEIMWDWGWVKLCWIVWECVGLCWIVWDWGGRWDGLGEHRLFVTTWLIDVGRG